MATLTTNLLHFNSHPKFQSSHSLSFSNFLHFQFRRSTEHAVVSQAIRTPKFDFNPRRFDDDDDDDGEDNYGDRSFQKKRGENKGRMKQRIWWSDELEEEDSGGGGKVEVSEIFGELVDNLWILKVFRPYGWFSPVILISLLLATGPKAFLMAYSLPFGLSVIIFAVQKIWGWPEGRPKSGYRRKRKRKSKYGRRKVDLMEEEDDLEEEIQQVKRNKTRVYRSRVVQNNGSFYKSDSGNTVNNDSFGGWDELVEEGEPERIQRPSGETSKPEIMMEKERLSRSMEERDLPLLLKLLVAFFPFLASWTNLL